MSDKQVSVVLDGNHFLIRCPFWANDLVASIPSRRWSKSKRAWAAPLTRKNAEHIMEKLVRPGYADIDDASIHAIDGLNAIIERRSKTNGFPSWYKFKTEPRDHQRRAYEKLYGLNEIGLLMDRGTGKSKTIIDIACAMRMEAAIDAVVVVCRLSLRRNWEGWDIGNGPGDKEGFIGHAPIPTEIYLPYTNKVKEFERWMAKKRDFPVLIVGTESLSAGRMHEMVRRFTTAYPNALMLVDESQDISSHKAIRSTRCLELGMTVKVRAILTGSPISTGPLNLYMPFEFLNSNIIGIGDFYAFRNRYAVMGGYRPKDGPMKGKPVEVVGYQNIDELTELLAPYVFDCRKSEVLAHLPPKTFERRYIQLIKEQRELYNEIKKSEAYEWAGKEVAVQNVLELALRLHQVAGGHVTTHLEVPHRKKATGEMVIKRVSEHHPIITADKNPKVIEVCSIAGDDKQQIIWCAYRPEIEMVSNALRDAYPKELVREFHGGISEDDRNTFKAEFQSGKAKYLISNAATGGAGHTLTAAETMVYYNNTEKMIDREQSEDRAHRDGLQHPVHYIDIIAEKTVDETIMASIHKKMDLADFIRRRIRQATDLLEGIV